jgi:hypothetical protein
MSSSDVIGYVVVEWNQASRLPDLTLWPDLHETEKAAQVELNSLREQAETWGRREQYRLAQVVLLGDED